MSNNSPKSIALRPSSSVKPVKEKYTFQPILIWKKQIALFWSLTLFWYQATQLQYLSHAALIVPGNLTSDWIFLLLASDVIVIVKTSWLAPLTLTREVASRTRLRASARASSRRPPASSPPPSSCPPPPPPRSSCQRRQRGPCPRWRPRGSSHMWGRRRTGRRGALALTSPAAAASSAPSSTASSPSIPLPTSTTPREVDSKRCSSLSSLGETKDEWECDGWAGVKFTGQILQYIC